MLNIKIKFCGDSKPRKSRKQTDSNKSYNNDY